MTERLDTDQWIAEMAERYDDNTVRIAVLEAEKKQLVEKIDALAEQQMHTSKKVDEMYNLMMQARGARWAILLVASGAGFFSGKLGSAVLAFLGTK